MVILDSSHVLRLYLIVTHGFKSLKKQKNIIHSQLKTLPKFAYIVAVCRRGFGIATVNPISSLTSVMKHNKIKHPLCCQVALWDDELTVSLIHSTAPDSSDDSQ